MTVRTPRFKHECLCIQCIEKRANRWPLRRRAAWLVKYLAIGALITLVMFAVWARFNLDLQMIESLVKVRQSADILSDELKTIKTESREARRCPL